jgi:ubiquinone/menaquinone biosynthesis C-methylase UbiE
MGISRDGLYKDEDLLEAARTVEKYILKLEAHNVFELATGRGATSSYLAKKYPRIQFEGIDISQGQLDFAFKKAKKIKNYRPKLGNYHNLKGLSPNKFDIVFVIEALCYSKKKEKVLREVYRILKKGGVFIIFDGYARKKDLTPQELLAKQLTERGMALSLFETYSSFKAKIKKTAFSIIYEEDVSEYIMPTLRKFEKLTEIFYLSPLMAKMIRKTFPPEFINNVLSASLMPMMIRLNIGCYYITVLKK